MPKEFNALNLVVKLSTNSFLIQTPKSKMHVTPGTLLDMPGKFFFLVDVLDYIINNLYVNAEGDVVVDLEQLQKELAPLDLNKFFTELESTLGLYPISNKTTENNTVQPSIPVHNASTKDYTISNTKTTKFQTSNSQIVEPQLSSEKKEEPKSEQTLQTETDNQKTENETKDQTKAKQTYTSSPGYKKTYTKKVNNNNYKKNYNSKYYNKSTSTNKTTYKKNYKKSETV